MTDKKHRDGLSLHQVRLQKNRLKKYILCVTLWEKSAFEEFSYAKKA